MSNTEKYLEKVKLSGLMIPVKLIIMIKESDARKFVMIPIRFQDDNTLTLAKSDLNDIELIRNIYNNFNIVFASCDKNEIEKSINKHYGAV